MGTRHLGKVTSLALASYLNAGLATDAARMAAAAAPTAAGARRRPCSSSAAPSARQATPPATRDALMVTLLLPGPARRRLEARPGWRATRELEQGETLGTLRVADTAAMLILVRSCSRGSGRQVWRVACPVLLVDVSESTSERENQ
jgi:hypothetical protein